MGAASSARTRIAAFALLAAAVIFALVSWRDPGYAHVRLAGRTVDPVAHGEVATFVVEAAPFSLIELSVNGSRVASTYLPWNARDVAFESTPLVPGRNRVVARTTLWYAASRRTHTAAIRVDDREAPVAEAGRARLEGRRPFAAWSGSRRSLALAIRQQEVAATFAVQLPRSDRAIGDVRAGRIDAAAFVDEIFAEPRFNQRPISSFFARSPLRFSAAGGSVTVSAESGYQQMRLADLPAFAGDVEVSNASTRVNVRVGGSGATDRHAELRRWAHDALRIGVEDYRVVALAPRPLTPGHAAYVWVRPFESLRRPVVVSLAFAPLSSIDAFRRGLNLSVFAFVPHAAARFLALFHGFVLAVPMFAYLVMSRGRNARLAAVARRLIVVAVAADVFDACISSQPDVDGEIRLIAPAIGSLPPAFVNLFFVPAVIALVLAILASCVAHLAARARSQSAAVIADAANAVRIALQGFIAIAAAAYATGHLARIPALYPALIGIALAVGLIALLVSVDWWTIPGRSGPRRAFWIVTAASALAVAVPSSLFAFGAWASVPEYGGTAFADPLSPLPLTTAFLRSLAPLCPLVFGLLLLAAVRTDTATLGLDRARFARLALCCYAVPAGVVVLVPVGFILAWCTYDLLCCPATAVVPRPDRDVAVATPRARGFAAMPLALAFVLLELLLLVPSETRYLRELHTPFVVLEAAGFLAVVVASSVMPAFAFAACNEQFRGNSGLRKGIAVAVWAIACSSPAWFLGAESVTTAAFVALATGLFYVALGSLTPLSGIARRTASRRKRDRDVHPVQART